MNTQQDDILFLRKMSDKVSLADQQQIIVYTDFMDLHEQSLISSHKKDFQGIRFEFNGGHKDSERKRVAFFPQHLQDAIEFTFNILLIKPQKKSPNDSITHRDYLGALINLGITRSKLGDLWIQEDFAIVFVVEQMSQFICDNLVTVKNVGVHIEIIEDLKDYNFEPKVVVIKGTVSTIRLDSVVKLGFSMSRGSAMTLIESAKVFVNSRCCEKGSIKLKKNDVISVRGHGKIKLAQIGELTKKDRIFIELHQYI